MLKINITKCTNAELFDIMIKDIRNMLYIETNINKL